MKTSAIWKYLQRVQQELKHGTLRTQDDAINALRDYIERVRVVRLFPSFLYPQFQEVLTYYCRTVLPQIKLCPEDTQYIREGFEHTLRQMTIQERTARQTETQIRNLLQRFKTGELTSLQAVVAEFRDLPGFENLEEPDYKLEHAFHAVRNAPFTSAHVVPFFDMFLTGGTPEEMRLEFERIAELFRDQLHTLLQMPVVLVNPATRTAQMMRMDVEVALEQGDDELRVVPDTVDGRMYISCLNAIQAVRTFLHTGFPEYLNDQALHVTCRFANPLLEYYDTSISLALAVKLVGDVLDMESDASILLSGEISASGELLTVRYLSEKAAAAGQHASIRQLWLPAGGQVVTHDGLEVVSVRTFAEVIERYYGKQVQQRRKEGYRQKITMPLEHPDVNDRSQSSSRLMSSADGVSVSSSFQPGGGASVAEKRPLAYSTRPPVGHCVDREALLARVKDDLRDRQKILIVIDGMAGIGKTTLAAKVAEEMEPELSGIYWTKCTPNTDLDQLLAEFAYFLGEHGDQTFANVFAYNIPTRNKLNFLIESLGTTPHPNPLSGGEGVKNSPPGRGQGWVSPPGRGQGWVSSPGTPKFLLVFDDVHELLDEQQAIRNPDLNLLFNQLLTQSHASKILLVSRSRPQFHRYQGSQSHATVESIREQAGIMLLRQLGIGEDDELLRQAYRLTSGHPLAMELLVSLTEALPLEDILADRRLFYDDHIVADQLLHELDATLNNDEQMLLAAIALLPHPATRELIIFLTANPNITPMLTSLIRKALLSYDRTQKVYKQHDLVRDFYRLKLDAETQHAIHLKAAEYYTQGNTGGEHTMTFQEVEQRLSARYHYFQAGEYEKAAQILVEVSEYLRERGYWERCRTLLEESLKSLEKRESSGERQLLKVNLLVELSWVEERTKSLYKAVEDCEKAENILKTINERKKTGNVYYAKGYFLYKKGEDRDWEQADSLLIQSFEIKKHEQDIKGLVEILDILRQLYRALGKWEKIETLCQKSISECKNTNDRRSQAEILVKVLGRALEEQRRFDEALKSYQESLILRSSDDFTGKALSLRMIAQILYKQANYKNALKKYEESLIFSQKADDVILQAYALRGIGDTYREMGRLDIAFEKYEECLEIMKTSNDLTSKAAVIDAIGNSYKDAGELDKALELFEQCLQLRRELGDLANVANSLTYIGNLYLERYSDLNKALEYHKDTLQLRKKLGRFTTVEWAMMKLAETYKKQGNLSEAFELYKEVLSTIENRNDFDCIATLNGIGSVYYAKGDFHKAFELYKKSFQLSEIAKRLRFKSDTLNHLGEIHIVFGNYEEALLTLKESLQLRTEVENFRKAEPLTNIATVYYHQNKLTEAMATCEESLALSRQYGGRIQLGITLHLMAKIRRATALKTGSEQHYAEALSYIQEAVQIFRETGSRHLPEAEVTSRELQELHGSQNAE